MESENRALPGAEYSWTRYLVVVILVLGSIAGLQVADLVYRAQDEAGPGVDSYTSVMQGDLLVKYALTFGDQQKGLYTSQAIGFYKKATPSPGAYRRIGLTRETILGESGWEELSLIDSPEATADLPADKVAEYRREVQLWRDIYGPGKFDRSRTEEYISRIRKLETGSLEKLVIADVYAKAGDTAKSRAVAAQAKREARISVIVFLAVMGLMILVGLFGIVLAVLFFTNYGQKLHQAARPPIQYPVLYMTFLAYLLGYLGLSVVMSFVMQLADIDMATSAGALAGVVLQLIAMICAFALGLSALWIMTAYTGEDPRQIGYIRLPWLYSLKWGAGGFAAMLPFFAIALMIWAILSSTIFRNIPTPENEVVQYLAAGSPVVIVITVLMAVVAAPIVEETFFRGALYGALRARMSVWGAAVLSAVLFASIHPLPGHFLPIVVIGTVLALLREKTGSLLPSMICHGLYNGIIMLIALLAY